MKRTPTLIDLHQQEPSEPLVQPPTYPKLWQQPATGQLLVMADVFPLAVALQPYAGTAMLGYTQTDRTILARVSGASTHVRVDVTNTTITGFSTDNSTTITGAFDGVDVRMTKSAEIDTTLRIWPTALNPANSELMLQAQTTTSDAIVTAPAADIDRQIEISEQKAPDTDSLSLDHAQAVTIWAGARTNDLTSL